MKFLVTFSVFFLWYAEIFAQQSQPIQIINAESLVSSIMNGERLQKLITKVELQQNNVKLFCDVANFYPDKNVVDANGDVHIIENDTINIYGDQLHYDGNTKKAQLTNHCRLTDTHQTLSTNQLNYDLNTREATYLNGGTLVNDSSTLTSRHGFYFSNSGDVFFKYNVQLKNPSYTLHADTLRFNVQNKVAYFLGPTTIHSDSLDVYCESGYYNTQTDVGEFDRKAALSHGSQILHADSIYFERKTGYGTARSRIHWTDTAEKLILLANYAEYYDQTAQFLATKKPVLIAVQDADSLFMRADTMYSSQDSTHKYRQLYAFHHVKIFKSDLQGVADSAFFSFADSTIQLYKSPVLWVNDNQMTADTMRLHLKNKKLYKIDLLRNAFAVNEVDSNSKLFNQMRGKNMFGFFENGGLKNINVLGNGESIYYAQNDSGDIVGVNKSICSNMNLIFDQKKIKEIHFINNPDATTYPLSKFPADESRLKNFSWKINLRPKSKEEIFQ